MLSQPASARWLAQRAQGTFDDYDNEVRGEAERGGDGRCEDLLALNPKP